MLKDMKCPCGRDGRYVQIIDGDEIYSCNKFQRCKTYRQLEDELSKQSKRLLVYQKFTNQIDDYFEYRFESKKDQQKVHQLLENCLEEILGVWNEY